jgi:uroporphyrinogen decarboxylase
MLKALVHEEPDRVPIDLGGMRSTAITGLAYNQLKSYWGMSGGHTRIYDLGQQLARVEPQVLERIGADVMPVSHIISSLRKWKPSRLPDGSPCEVPDDFNPEKLDDGSLVVRDETGRIVSRMPPNGYYFDGEYHPLADATSIADLKDYPFYTPMSKEELDTLEDDVKTAYETTSYALMLGSAGSVYEAAQGLRGWDVFLMDLAGDPQFAGYLMDRLVDASIQRLEQILPRVKELVQVVQVGDDLGHQNGPQISPELYRKMVKPRHKRLYQFIKKNSDAHLFLHTCGSVYQLIPDLIEVGVDILNPVQVAARDMDTARLKKQFGDEMAFWGGGCDTQNVLPFGTPQQVRDEVKRRIDDLAPGGGFVFNQVHNIQVGVPPENIEAMFDAALEFGSY